MKQSLLAAACLALLGATAAHAQVCMSTPENGAKVCLSVPGQIECEAGSIPGVTLVQQSTDVSVVLAGTQVCILRVVQGSQIAGDPLVAVLAKVVVSTDNGSTKIVTREAQFYASQLSGATQSSALTLSK